MRAYFEVKQMDTQKVPALIIGTGPTARLALDILQSKDVLVYGFITNDDDMLLQELNDVLVVAKADSQDGKSLLGEEYIKFILSEVEITTRKEWVEILSAYSGEIATAVHNSSWISPYAKLGRGNLINSGVHINANAMIGSFNYVESNVTIEVDVAIGDYCNIHTGAIIGQGVQVHDGVTIGSGAIIYQGVTIGRGAYIGPGSVVMKDVDENQSVFGNPAQAIG